VKEQLTVVTRKGQITLPAEMRRLLGIKQGDKVAVSVEDAGSEQPRLSLKPVRSVAEMTFGAVRPRKRPEDFKELRRAFEEGLAQEAVAETQPDGIEE
jgi:AbrB family looped-hinge helix DNA binding protein